MRRAFIIAVLGIFGLSFAATAFAKECDPTVHGGKPDDEISDTGAIQQAIDGCQGTGGTVVLGKGRWEVASLILGSNMTFRLEQDAVLALIPDITLYPEDPLHQGNDLRRRALYADNVRNLIIEGPGVIEGRGQQFWDENFYETGLKRPTLPRPMPVLAFTDSENVMVRNLRLQNLPGFAIAFTGTIDGLAKNIAIRNDRRSPNTDGIQIRNSSRIRITGADIETGDDAVVLKSNDRPVDRIIVENSRLVSDDGAVKFGTGSRVGVTNSIFRNLEIEDSRYGIAIFMIDGGHHKDNLFENIRIKTGGRHSRTYPIFVDIDRREADRDWGKITGLTFRDLDIRSSGASLIAGNRVAPITGLTLDNIKIRQSGDAAELLERASKPRGNKNIRDQEGSVDYSDVKGELVIAHAENVTLKSVILPTCRKGTGRKGLVLIDTKADVVTVTNAEGCDAAR